MADQGGAKSVFSRGAQFPDRTAVIDDAGAHSYADLRRASAQVAAALLESRSDLAGERIAFLAPPGVNHVAVQWGIWRAGGVAVPLALSHPWPEIEYVLQDTAASTLICSRRQHPLPAGAQLPGGCRLLSEADLLGAHGDAALPDPDQERAAMILYTSGTTSRPKGVVLTHANLRAQIESLVEAWEWSAADHILHVLPLHHVHGIVNVLCCALWSGATCEFLPRFDAQQLWSRMAEGRATLLMAVPTIYAKLIAAFDEADSDRQRQLSAGCERFRLMVSGSAALPVSTLQRWREISGHTLLERYGMTEIGMALSNPLHGTRRPGHVGAPLPGVEVRRMTEDRRPALDDVPAELQVRGPSVFRQYWNRPQATREAFVDGWFRTGDVTVVDNGAYRILGRQSVDIIKTGGYKVSALEIEEVLRGHPAIAECAVVGVPDDEWGERVAACVVVRPGSAGLTLPELREWTRQRLAPYKAPSGLLTVGQLPRNAMGKVQKPQVVQLLAEAPQD